MFLMDMFLMDSFKETHLPIAAWELGMCVFLALMYSNVWGNYLYNGRNCVTFWAVTNICKHPALLKSLADMFTNLSVAVFNFTPISRVVQKPQK